MNTDSLNLSDLYQLIWKKIEKAVVSRHEAWHLVTVGTVRENEPEIRTLVLRGASAEQGTLWMHTDMRSPKCRDIEKAPQGSLLFYDPHDRWQLRMKGVFSLDSNSDLSESAWNKTTASARRCYQGPAAPGTPSEEIATNLPSENVEPSFGRENFSRLIFTVSKMDWLFLRAEGHQRAQWELLSKEVRGTWLNP
jgi:general stress protein 26